MKTIYKLTVMLFTIILVISTLTILISTNIITIKQIDYLIDYILDSVFMQCTAIITSAILILLSLSIIFGTRGGKKPIILQGSNGELVITGETIENISNNTVRSFEGTKEVKSTITMDKSGKITVYIGMQVMPNVKIANLTENLQTKIKEDIKTMTGVEVSTVNVNVKDIYEEAKKEM